MKNTNQKIANEMFVDYPKENVVYITEDGQAFFDELAAKNHAKNRNFENPEVFFREGHEPEDKKELEEELLLLKEDYEVAVGQLELIEQVTDLTQVAPQVDTSTSDVVAKVVTLRQQNEVFENEKKELEASRDSLQSVLTEIVEGVARACDIDNDVPEMTVSDEALPVIKQVLELRAKLADASNQIATLKAKSIEVDNATEEKPKKK